jgi:AcrR family transcriptional regulator
MVDRVLNAADRCIARDGLDRTSMSSVAREAGVSRQTLHRLFDTREQMVCALASRQIERLLKAMLPKVAAKPTAQARVVAFALMWGRGLPKRMRASEAFRSDEFRRRVAQMLAPTQLTRDIMIDHLGKLLADVPGVEDLRHRDDIEGLASVVHHFSSDIRSAFGGARTEADDRAHLERYLLPALFNKPHE